MSYKTISNQVANIIEDIKKNGDKAVFSYIRKFDGIDLSKKGFKVSNKDINNAANKIPLDLRKAIKASFDNVSAYHKYEYKQIKKHWFFNAKGLKAGQIL
ncbi:MAG: histidinol dehydrogenase, partial [Elusimicrobiota bacterium]|nr:histidinol dehydrogenase [Elusimicrobiota bacterium]